MDIALHPALWVPPKPAIIRSAPDLLLPGKDFDLSLVPGIAVAHVGVPADLAPPSVVQRPSNFGSARATSFSPSWTAAAAGNLIVLELAGENTSTVTTPSGFTLAHTKVDNGSGIRLASFYKTAAGGETGVSVSQSNSAWAWIMREVSGWNTGPVWGTAATGTSNAPNPPSISPGSAGQYLVIGGAAYASSTTSAYSSGYSNGLTASSTGSNLVRIASAERQLSIATSEDPAAMTIAASNAWIGYTWAVGNI